jgi:hypothetical protein
MCTVYNSESNFHKFTIYTDIFLGLKGSLKMPDIFFKVYAQLRNLCLQPQDSLHLHFAAIYFTVIPFKKVC